MDRYLDSPAATDALGRQLAKALKDPALLVILKGELGTGKTALVRAFLHGLGHPGRVRSPTYTLMEPYFLGGKQVLHLDLYQWPERAGDLLPMADLEVLLAYEGDGRRVRISAGTDRGRQLLLRLDEKD
jgi:tRNA threonylcarbamoyladenosine biosynthesis protein TsaE